MNILSVCASICSQRMFSTVRCCPAFEPLELATAGLFRSLRQFQSSHARVDKPLFIIGLKDLWLYPHLVWPVRRNRCPGCGRGRMLATAWNHTRQLGARWGPTLENCPKKHTTVHLTRFTTLHGAPTHTHTRSHACTHACTHARTHARTHACTHARTHTNTHTNQCMRMWSTIVKYNAKHSINYDGRYKQQ